MTDDVAGPAFWPDTNVSRAVNVAKQAYEEAAAAWETSVGVDAALLRHCFVPVDPFDLEETAERFDVVAVIDVGTEHLIPVAIRARRTDDGGMVWWWEHVSSEPRHRDVP